MKYALLAVGLLLLFIGSYFVYSGVAIIEVERGWTSVIAGTTAAVGGVLVLGIAWVIRSLEQLHALLRTNATNAATAPGLQPAYEIIHRETLHETYHGTHEDFGRPMMDLPTAPVAWPPHISPSHLPEADQNVLAERAFERAEAEQAAETFDESAYRSFAAEANEILSAPFNEQVAGPARATPSASVRDLWRRVAKKSDKPPSVARRAMQNATQATEPAFVQPPPLPKAATAASTTIQPTEEDREAEIHGETSAEKGDWLDNALAEFDSAIAPAPHPHPAEAAADFEPYKDMADEEPAPPLAAEPAEAEHPAATEEPAIIGRYDAEGTCYIMFADGSIEAQSERGVARFKSMADLKAYFETQETP